MGNIHIHPPSPRRPSITSTVYSNVNNNAEGGTTRGAAAAALAMFILGGPMPPSPGLIPLCWEDLIDWTDDATAITEQIYQRSQDEIALSNLLPAAGLSIDMIRGIRFIPHVSVQETDAGLRKLASQSYLERAQFYQESVVIAVKKSMEDEGVLCLISVFQFCRFFTLIRRLADSQLLVLEYQSSDDDLVGSLAEVSPPVEEEGDSRLLMPGFAQQLQSSPNNDGQQQLYQDCCVICLEKKESSVLHCCSQAICTDCERRWVRKRLRCPFCRQSFASVKEAIQTQWQLSSAIPVEQVVQDILCLGEKIQTFWEGLGINQNRSSESDDERLALANMLQQNYIERQETLRSRPVEEGDGFILIDG